MEAILYTIYRIVAILSVRLTGIESFRLWLQADLIRG